MLCGGGRRAAGQRAQETTRQQQATRADPRLFLTHTRTYSLSKSSMPKLATAGGLYHPTPPLVISRLFVFFPGSFLDFRDFDRLVFAEICRFLSKNDPGEKTNSLEITPGRVGW